MGIKEESYPGLPEKGSNAKYGQIFVLDRVLPPRTDEFSRCSGFLPHVKTLINCQKTSKYIEDRRAWEIVGSAGSVRDCCLPAFVVRKEIGRCYLYGR